MEICINNAWGTVCETDFGSQEATVICTQLGFSERGKAAIHVMHEQWAVLLVNVLTVLCFIVTSKHVMFPLVEARILNAAEYIRIPRRVDGPIFLDRLDCTAGDTALFQCESAFRGLTLCTHEEDAGVHCEGIISESHVTKLKLQLFTLGVFMLVSVLCYPHSILST